MTWYGTGLVPGGLPKVRMKVSDETFCTPLACTVALGSYRPSSRNALALYMFTMAVMPARKPNVGVHVGAHAASRREEVGCPCTG